MAALLHRFKPSPQTLSEAIPVARFVLGCVPVAVAVNTTLGGVGVVEGTSMQPTLNPQRYDGVAVTMGSAAIAAAAATLMRGAGLRSPVVAAGAAAAAAATAGFGGSWLSRDWMVLNRGALRAVPLMGSVSRGDVVVMWSPQKPGRNVIKRVIALEGDWIKTQRGSGPTLKVPPGHCWVEGDNRFTSNDSNTYGSVPLALIDSKAECVIWPPRRIGATCGTSSPPTTQSSRVLVKAGASSDLDLADKHEKRSRKKSLGKIAEEDAASLDDETFGSTRPATSTSTKHAATGGSKAPTRRDTFPRRRRRGMGAGKSSLVDAEVVARKKKKKRQMATKAFVTASLPAGPAAAVAAAAGEVDAGGGGGCVPGAAA